MDLPTLPTYVFDLSTWSGRLSLFMTVLLPLVVGFITRPSTPSHVKGLSLLALAGVKAVLEALVIGGADFNLTNVVVTTGLNFGIAVLMYFGLLRGSPVAEKAQSSGVK